VRDEVARKKAGADRMVGLCPFHPEKTPSFGVSPAKQVYHCFGCGEGGNVFRFLEKIEGLTFVEVVEKLAAEAGVQLRYEGSAPGDKRITGRRQVMHKAVAEAADDAVLLAAPLSEALTAISFAVVAQQVAVEIAIRHGRDPERPSGLSKVTRTR